MNLKAPDLIMQGNTSFCPGCGHGIIGRLLFENIVEMGYEENSVTVVYVACCSLLMYSTNADFVGAAHGRVLPGLSVPENQTWLQHITAMVQHIQ